MAIAAPSDSTAYASEAQQVVFPEINVSVVGLGSQYPKHNLTFEDIKQYVCRQYPQTTACGIYLRIVYITELTEKLL